MKKGNVKLTNQQWHFGSSKQMAKLLETVCVMSVCDRCTLRGLCKTRGRAYTWQEWLEEDKASLDSRTSLERRKHM